MVGPYARVYNARYTVLENDQIKRQSGEVKYEIQHCLESKYILGITNV